MAEPQGWREAAAIGSGAGHTPVVAQVGAAE
jgi:hypothetical protein